MSDQDNEPVSPETETTQPALDPAAVADELLKSILNKDGEQKYSTTEKALESIRPKDDHIKQLKEDKEKLEQTVGALSDKVKELDSRMTITDTLADKLAQKDTQVEQPSGAALDEQRLNEIIASHIESKDIQKIQQANMQTYVEAIAAETDSPKDYINAKAASLGIGVDTFKQIITQSPEAALKLGGTDTSKPIIKTKSGVNTQGLAIAPKEDPSIPTFKPKRNPGIAKAEELMREVSAKYN